jgi:hypothetical protein
MNKRYMDKKHMDKKGMDLFSYWGLFLITTLFNIDRFYKMKET